MVTTTQTMTTEEEELEELEEQAEQADVVVDLTMMNIMVTRTPIMVKMGTATYLTHFKGVVSPVQFSVNGGTNLTTAAE